MKPPSNILIFLSALGEPVFAAGADEQIGGYAVPAPIAAVLTGRLRPDVQHTHSPPLLPLAFVVFNQGFEFLIAETLSHTVKPGTLAPDLS
jgi:hypothetical protein